MDLADKFREELGIFYSRQEGVFQNLSDEEKKQLGITDDRDMRIRPLAQTFLAVQGDVYNMGHLPDVFESQQLVTAHPRLDLADLGVLEDSRLAAGW